MVYVMPKIGYKRRVKLTKKRRMSKYKLKAAEGNG